MVSGEQPPILTAVVADSYQLPVPTESSVSYKILMGIRQNTSYQSVTTELPIDLEATEQMRQISTAKWIGEASPNRGRGRGGKLRRHRTDVKDPWWPVRSSKIHGKAIRRSGELLGFELLQATSMAAANKHEEKGDI
ncbi:hypothetical protein L484_022119 [Morus notabilis]|uniref:Uncharacterized protein n=1 Tax=Morus notabilis TaxID=981085 RepID=W9QKQ3_9ROSA|nr:hypothetical protein L484_022119 [Morus notabilis]